MSRDSFDHVCSGQCLNGATCHAIRKRASRAASWTRNGLRFWQLVTGDAEIVAVVTDAYKPYSPPVHAAYEVYSRKRGVAKFLGYLDGEARERAHVCFAQAFRSFG